ncbi:MAG: DUF3987 domain-containing protein [Rubrobacter sp.]
MSEKLRDLPQWIVWRSEMRDGKPTKIPYSPRTGRRASSTDSDTWGGIEVARAACASGGADEEAYDGIGFVFTAEDPFLGVDLDGCLDPETGEIERWAAEIIEELDSYTEISPSGSGVHVLVRAELPAGRNRKGRFEAYDRGRYFTVTGKHLSGTPQAIGSRQEELRGVVRRVFGGEAPESANGHAEPVVVPETIDNGLSDDEVVQKALSASNGERFARLWAGDTSGYGSHSEADLALCRMLAFWAGGDAARIEALFRQSHLYRVKWERPDYRRRTIEMAFEGDEFYSLGARHEAPAGRDGKDATGGRSEGWPQARTLPEAVEFPVEVLPPECRALVREAVGALGCAPELVALPALATLSSAVGATRVIEIKRGWREGTTFYIAVVASPGAMKSPAAKVALAPVHEKQEDHKARYAEEKEDHELEYREWEVEKKLASKNDEPAPDQPIAPNMQRAIVSDTTLEALVGVLEANPRGFLVHRDEIAGWLRSMDQYRSGGKGSDRQHWLSMWDNQPFVVDRKSRLGEPIILSRPVVSLFGGIQPAMLGEMGGAMEDGMMDRFLFGYPTARRIRYNEREVSEQAERRYAELYYRLAGLQLAADDNGTPNPKALKLTLDAKRLFAEAVDSLGDETLEPGFPARLEGVWSKMRGYLARISLLFALCRHVSAPSSEVERVEVEDVEAAGKLVGYFKAHARRVYAELREADPLDALGADLKDFLEEAGGEWVGTPTELHAELRERGAEGLPANAVNLTKRARVVASRSAALDVRRGKSDGARVLRLSLKPSVPTVPSVPEETPDRDSRDTKDSRFVEKDGECKHGYAGGKGCYLCDPDHPYRLREASTP